MTPEAIGEKLQTRIVGRSLRCVETCESTNDLAWREALDGAADGTVVFAEEQTKGRGRFGRSWIAPKGEAILCSIILRPRIGVDRVPLITALGALAAAEVAGPGAHIRFPNDVLVEAGKVAGVLVEARFVSSRPEVFIVGIGLNVTAHPPGVGAASLGSDSSRITAARELLQAADAWYARLGGDLEEWRRAWRDRSLMPGRRVKVRMESREVTGTVEEIDPLDGIVLRLESGHPCSLRSEHVDHLEVLE